MRPWQWTVIVMAVLIAGFAATIVAIGFFLSPQDQLRKVDIIVAISGGETQARTKEAVRLYRAGYAPKLLFSGAAQDKSGPSNAAAMRQEAIKDGVPSEDILIEEDSANTAENAIATAPILKAIGAQSIILVTSPYHQRRASIDFHQILGRNAVILNHSAPDSSWRKNSWWTDPFTWQLTFSELQKTIYAYSTKPETTQK
jgi:uncharacterized SAM-binding protein YcdF (DUF218 family)